MKVRGREIKYKQLFYLIIYYGVARYFPSFGGKRFRRFCCKHIFKSCGNNVNIEYMANFGIGLDIEIGDNSGIGVRAYIPCNTKIGKNVMMGPNCYILSQNHAFSNVDIPMIEQGYTPIKKTIIEDDVWIGRDVLMTPGRIIRKGSIVAGGCVLCKDFPEYSIIGGNPSKLIRCRVSIQK